MKIVKMLGALLLMANFSVPSNTYAPGVHTVGPFTMPSNVNLLAVAFTVSAPDISDPTVTLDYEMDCFDGTTWNFDNGFKGWQGGVVNKVGQPIQPGITVSGLSHLWGKQCQVIITNTKSITTAIAVSTS